jgi:hypothetical protein
MSTPARTAELTGVRQFQIVERSIPDPGPGEVQVRVAAVGVCGSDLHSYSEGAVGDSPCVYPMVIRRASIPWCSAMSLPESWSKPEQASLGGQRATERLSNQRCTAITASSAAPAITTSAPTCAS